MTPKLLLASLFVLFSISGRVFCQSNSAAYRPVIAIQFDDLAGVSKPVLDRAKTVLTDVYTRIGIDVIWITAGCSANESHDCQASKTVGLIPVTLLRRGHANASATGQRWSPRSTATTVLPNETNGGDITVFYDRVEDVVRSYLVDASSADRALGIVLGYLLAHEIGHVLLPDGKHSAFGIMSAHLFATGEQWHNAMQGSLFFQSGQPAVLRNGALARAYGDQARTLRR